MPKLPEGDTPKKKPDPPAATGCALLLAVIATGCFGVSWALSDKVDASRHYMLLFIISAIATMILGKAAEERAKP